MTAMLLATFLHHKSGLFAWSLLLVNQRYSSVPSEVTLGDRRAFSTGGLETTNRGLFQPAAYCLALVCLFVNAVGRRHHSMQRAYKTTESEVDGPKVTRGGGYAQLLKRCM